MKCNLFLNCLDLLNESNILHSLKQDDDNSLASSCHSLSLIHMSTYRLGNGQLLCCYVTKIAYVTVNCLKFNYSFKNYSWLNFLLL